MSFMVRAVCLLTAAILGGCQTHAVFSEASHAGLLVELNTTGAVPINVDVGYERGVFIMLPQRLTAERADKKPIPECGESTVILHSNPGELASLYAAHDANIGLWDPFRVKHFLATGTAAAYVVANPHTLDYLWDEEGGPEASATPATPDGTEGETK